MEVSDVRSYNKASKVTLENTKSRSPYLVNLRRATKAYTRLHIDPVTIENTSKGQNNKPVTDRKSTNRESVRIALAVCNNSTYQTKFNTFKRQNRKSKPENP
jgi:hypothetical protein